MKKNILTIMIVSLVLFISCTDNWLNTVNENDLDLSSFLTTENDLALSINAAYTPLGHFGMFGMTYLFVFNALDPYIWFENPETGYDIMQISKDAGSNVSEMWTALYIGLFRTSDIIARMPSLKDKVPVDNYNKYEAQLRALRAMYYFYLVTIFDKPIFYDETNVPYDAMATFGNGDQAQFWDKLEEDLSFAIEYLPDEWGSNDKGRITQGGANALLGKALLFKHYHYYKRFEKENTSEANNNLQSASEAFKRVINSPYHDLMQPVDKTDKNHYYATLLSNFSYLDIPVKDVVYDAENNKESLWEVQFNDDHRNSGGAAPAITWGGNRLYEWFSPHNSAYKNHEIDPSLWLQFETIPTSAHSAGYEIDPRAYITCYIDGDMLDWREDNAYYIPFNSVSHSKLVVKNFNLFPGPEINIPGGKTTNAFGLKKYYYPQFTEKRAPRCAPQNVRIIRFADVLLMYAETLLLLNNDASGDGLRALNQVRDRAGMPNIANLTHDAIKHERTVELATEGHQYHDIIRWQFDSNFNIDLNSLFRGHFIYPTNLYFPIPQSEIDNNKGSLIQNIGY